MKKPGPEPWLFFWAGPLLCPEETIPSIFMPLIAKYLPVATDVYQGNIRTYSVLPATTFMAKELNVVCAMTPFAKFKRSHHSDEPDSRSPLRSNTPYLLSYSSRRWKPSRPRCCSP